MTGPASRPPRQSVQTRTLSASINRRLAAVNPNMGEGSRKQWPGEPNNGVVDVDIVDMVVDRDARFTYSEYSDTQMDSDGRSKKTRDLEVPAIAVHFIYSLPDPGGDPNADYRYNEEGKDKILLPYDIDALPKGKMVKGKEVGNQQARADRELAKLMGAFLGLYGYEMTDVNQGLRMMEQTFKDANANGQRVSVRLMQKFSPGEFTKDGQKIKFTRASGFIQECISMPGDNSPTPDDTAQDPEPDPAPPATAPRRVAPRR